MRIDKITIQNFRCFENIDFQFGKKATVFLGKNGTGKSNLLSSIRKGLSFVFAENKEDINFLKSNNNNAIRPLVLWDTRYDEFKGFCFPTSIDYQTTFNEKSLNWTFLKKTNSGNIHSTLYRDAKTTVLSELQQSDSEWPLFAFFADSYPHIEMNLGNKARKIIVESNVLPRDFGYYGWDEHTNCNSIWIPRFIRANYYLTESEHDLKNLNEQIVKQEELIAKLENELKTLSGQTLTEEELRAIFSANKINSDLGQRLNSIKARRNAIVHNTDKLKEQFQQEKNYIEDKIIAFTTSASDKYRFINAEFEITRVYTHRATEDETLLQFDFKNGTVMNYNMLPMGYKRLLSIVFDIAYRAYILNQGKSEAKGIVIIDEIELHLHPTLQQEVLQRFMNTFPELQFIVTTHSPLVLSNLKVDDSDTKLIQLYHQNNEYTREYLESVYGLGYDTNLNDVMGVAPRASTIDKYINGYLFLFGKKREAEANKILDKLKEYLGGNIPTLLQKEIENQKKAYL